METDDTPPVKRPRLRSDDANPDLPPVDDNDAASVELPTSASSKVTRPSTSKSADSSVAKNSEPSTSGPPTSDKLEQKLESMFNDEALARQLQDEHDESAQNLPRPIQPSLVLDTREVQDAVLAFAQPLIKVKCQSCQKLLFKNSGIESFAQLLMRSGGTLKQLDCGSCGTHWHCETPKLHLVMIWIVLCSFDTTSKYNKPGKNKKMKSKTQDGGDEVRERLTKRKSRMYEAPSNGIGYGGDSYSHDYSQPSKAASSGSKFGPGRTLGSASTIPQEGHFLPLDKDDGMTSVVMGCLARLLSDLAGEDDTYGDTLPESLRSILLCSSVLERAADLLRNNDLENVTSRATLYLSLVELVHALSDHPSTSSLVFEERVVRPSGASILQISLGKSDLIDSRQTVTTQPLSQCLRELGSQAEIMLKHGDGEPNEALLFRSIKDLSELMAVDTRSMRKTGPAVNKNAWHRDLQVLDLADEHILSRHSLVDGSKTDKATRPAGQMKRIMQEIARLKGGLPEGIFVRHCETRPDVMKILIVGPRDSPYENGLFEFDLLCGADFPQGPPKMDFRTTGGGMVHFNPNLYVCGKICLSILGTWQDGEPWREKESTLLQILVSIQAMILCEHPYNNEPGRENFKNDDPESTRYNRSLHPHTVGTAMLDWLESRRFDKVVTGKSIGLPQAGFPMISRPKPKHDPSSIWSGIVKRHFESNAKEIMARVGEWIDAPAVALASRRRSTQGDLDNDNSDSDYSDCDDDDGVERDTGHTGTNSTAPSASPLSPLASSHLHDPKGKSSPFGAGQVLGGGAAKWPSTMALAKKLETKSDFAGTGWKGQVLGGAKKYKAAAKMPAEKVVGGTKLEDVEAEKVAGELVEFLRDALGKLLEKSMRG